MYVHATCNMRPVGHLDVRLKMMSRLSSFFRESSLVPVCSICGCFAHLDGYMANSNETLWCYNIYDSSPMA